MFEREHHRNVALVLQGLDPAALAARRCYFGGGTAMALRYGEYRESVDIDFMVSDAHGYRDLRQMLGGVHGLAPLMREGLHLQLAREVITDRYGIRTQIRAGASVIKFEIVLEGRIELDEPGPQDAVCGIATLTSRDLAAEKLLANADRWADDAVFSRDLIDLAMLDEKPEVLRAGCAKAEAAYGAAIRKSLDQAVTKLRSRDHRLEDCMTAMRIDSISKAQLWHRIRRVHRVLVKAVDEG
ncbi:MAG: hypothetical protein JWP27_3088 [Flaviaesturariibacter sp.]|nr:hypothetical protein [Flaviaesturariibacter sp.]